MKRNTTLNNKKFSSKKEKENSNVKLEPKQSTLDFLMAYSKALHVEKLNEDETVELILN